MKSRLCLSLLLVGILVTPAMSQAVGPTLNHCQFSWQDATVTSDQVSGFNVYMGTTTGGPYALIGTVPATAATAYGPTANLCTGIPDGQKYAVVKAANAAGTESGASNEVPFVLLTTTPSAPSSLRVQ